jgi:hypothetical protein
VLRFEDLIQDTAATLNNLEAFTGIKITQEMKDYLAAKGIAAASGPEAKARPNAEQGWIL